MGAILQNRRNKAVQKKKRQKRIQKVKRKKEEKKQLEQNCRKIRGNENYGVGVLPHLRILQLPRAIQIIKKQM